MLNSAAVMRGWLSCWVSAAALTATVLASGRTSLFVAGNEGELSGACLTQHGEFSHGIGTETGIKNSEGLKSER